MKSGPFAPKAAPKPAAPPADVPAAAPGGAQPQQQQPVAPGAAQQQTQQPAAPPNPQTPAVTQRPPDASDLVIFIAPSSASLLKNDKVEATLSVSGGQGLSAGYLDLQVPPGLKVVNVVPGDFLGGGKVDQAPGPGGTLRLSFNRNGAGADSGVLAAITLQAVDGGNQPLLIQGGQFMAGANPISARWVNALFTVQ